MFSRLVPVAGILSLLLCLNPCHARWKVDVETGYVFSGYNEARIPNKTGTLISLSEELSTDPELFFRARVIYSFNNRHSLTLLVAPLRLNAEGSVDKAVSFAGGDFAPNVPLKGKYRFDSYRLTYRYEVYSSHDVTAGIGLTAKIRDASISLADAEKKSEKKNTGFVPLINFRVDWRPSDRVNLLLDGDALAAPQGRAEDVLVAFRYQVQKNVALKLGYRFLEGGADVDETYNFTMIHYLVTGADISF